MKTIQILILIALLSNLGVAVYQSVQRSKLEKQIDLRRSFIQSEYNGTVAAEEKIYGRRTELQQIAAKLEKIDSKLELLLDLQGDPTQ